MSSAAELEVIKQDHIEKMTRTVLEQLPTLLRAGLYQEPDVMNSSRDTLSEDSSQMNKRLSSQSTLNNATFLVKQFKIRFSSLLQGGDPSSHILRFKPQLSTPDLLGLFHYLKHDSHTTEIQVHDSNIDESSLPVLSDALSLNNSLKTLELSNNVLGNHGLQVLSAALYSNHSLTSLILPHNEIGLNGIVALVNSLSKNTTLQVLNLGFNNLEDRSAIVLAKLLHRGSLKKLLLEGNQIADVGSKALSHALMYNNCLLVLDVSFNPIGRDGVQALKGILKNNKTIRELNVTFDNDTVADGSSRPVPVFSTVKASLPHQDGRAFSVVGAGGPHTIRRHPSLPTIHEHRPFSEVYSNTKSRDNELLELQSVISARPRIKTLEPLPLDEHGKQAQFLRLLNTYVQYGDWDMSYCRITKPRERDLEGFAHSLSHNASVEILAVIGEGWKRSEIEFFSRALISNTVLKEIDLTRCKLGDGCVRYLCLALPFTGISKVNLSHNNITAKGALAISSALSSCTALQTLILSSNKLGDEGVLALGTSLRTNPFLKLLDISFNLITDIGVKALVELLGINKGLERVSLIGNTISAEGVEYMKRVGMINSKVQIEINGAIWGIESTKGKEFPKKKKKFSGILKFFIRKKSDV